MRQLFQVVSYLHENRICHRDLKPDNILIQTETETQTKKNTENSSQACRVKLIDFNVAFKATEGDKIMGSTGLREWSAPETRTKLHSDFSIDCWTLGCVMYLLCTGEQPF